ncbi:tRNA threonylcarbamoyladenosine dehydratase [Tichowtungia aerotolerans]|uniref:tRNA threonylcarbamoyladenosine dehydratase n=1 Tax=Tichowtungia aerotolerans TaxID=2697043 RepID=A0A6P1M3G2_9BACT|nr:tRNA threonylcarbamoyladenosine dehydratase [Tichowtungia aerotolerans]QHI68642.1 tRNA threonylcarbamoyladenosine dehydratase [Tichowtungia aerotolerans]
MKFHRTKILIGDEALERLTGTHVILFGVGGVGSWCAEALIRSGLGKLTIVDNDVVCETNINRQMQATSKTIGQLKVEALKKRLLEIHPDAQIETKPIPYNRDTRESFDLSQYDYVIDAIDSLSHKVNLIASAMEAGTTLFSAMGAASKIDPTTIKVDSIWKSKGCRLARFVRKRLRKRGADGDCLCVYSPERFSLFGDASEPEEEDVDAWSETKAQTNGSMIHMTGTFGFHLAGLVVQDVVRMAME